MYNPYDLVQLKINGHELYGRPVEFDSEPVDTHTMLNKDGNILRPTKITSTCPDCGQGLLFDVKVGDPPYYIELDCYLCVVKTQPHINPFMNPIEDGRIKQSDIDPLLYNNENLIDVATAVSDRVSDFGQTGDAAPSKATKAAKRARKPKKGSSTKQPTKTAKPLEKAEGLTEEIDFDDADMIETE